MVSIKNQENLRTTKCRHCGKEYKDVGLFIDEILMVPDCDCQKVNIAIDRSILAKLMAYAQNGIFYSRMCNILLTGDEYPRDGSKSMEWKKNFDYIQEIMAKQTGMIRTEYNDSLPGNVKLYNLIQREIAPLRYKDVTIDYIKFRDKKIPLPRWIRLHYKVSSNRVCKYCGESFQECSVLIGKLPFTYSIKPRCDCHKRIKIGIHKGLVPHMLGALVLGQWTEGACANLIHNWSKVYDNVSERYGNLTDEIIDEIETQTGVEDEYMGYGGCNEARAFISNSIREERNRCDKERGFPVQNEWDFFREMKNDFKEDKK